MDNKTKENNNEVFRELIIKYLINKINEKQS